MVDVSNRPISVGIIGLGRAGWNIHVKRLRDDERFKIEAVADPEADRRDEARAELGCETFEDYTRLLANSNCEVIVVASQSVDHGQQSIAALESGHHVIVEKPMAFSTEEAIAMIEAGQTAGRKLFVHQNYRYSPDVHHLQNVMRSGLLGRIFEIDIRVCSLARRNDWQTLRKFGGGNLNNQGAHFLDIGLMLLDSPVQRMFADLQLTLQLTLTRAIPMIMQRLF